MDYLTQMKEISDYYKGRYEKAVALGISEGSKHYEAFKEIQLRYGATETAAECMEILKEYLYIEDFERNVYGAIKLVIDVLSISDTIMNEDGEIECIPKRVKLSKDDQTAVASFKKAKTAINRLKNLDYNTPDREPIYYDIIKCFYEIVDWMLIARDTVYRVGRRTN